MSHRDAFFSLVKLRIWLYSGIALLIVIAGIVYLFCFTPPSINTSVHNHQSGALPVDIYQWGSLVARESGFSLPLIIAETKEQQECGLSFSSGLPANTGMLFDFSTTGGLDQHGFWMKDMKYSLDMIWFDDRGRVIGSHTSVSPDTFPEVFDVDSKSMYVLELPAGFVDSHENIFIVGNGFDIYKDKQFIKKRGLTLCE